MYKVAIDTFGKRAKKNKDWFTAGIEGMEPAITAKGAADLEYKRDTCDKTLAAYREARNSVKSIS